jgi:acyl-CoA synthetase (AMP-forming)/AMP-acid ligase II
MNYPFDRTGVERDEQGIARYTDLKNSIVEMLRSAVDDAPNNEALVELGGRRLNYQQFWDEAARVAGGLKKLGVERGDRVAVRLANGVDWCLAFYGAQMVGAIAVPVNTRFSESEVEYVVNDSGSKFIFQPGEALPDGDPFVIDDLTGDEVSAIFYTSGTTGFPKGAMTTHENFLSNIETCFRINLGMPKDGSMRNLISVPLFHVTGCNSQLLPTIEGRGAVVIMPAFNVQDFLKAIVDERIAIVTSVPAIHWLAINQPQFKTMDVSHVRWVTYGGAPTAPELVAQLMEAYPNARLGNGFGLTETSSVSTFLPHEFANTRPETVGFAAPVVDVDLFEVDSETGVGELLIRGQNVVVGYWNKPEATANTFINGWLHSGDLAKIDSDGFVQIVDRKKDMICRGGENVYCVEVENAIAAHPAVFEVAVLGVPDDVMGEKVGAIIFPKPGQTIDPRELVTFTRTLIADFKAPQYVVISQTPLPRNPNGKILKPKLRQDTEWGESIKR